MLERRWSGIILSIMSFIPGISHHTNSALLIPHRIQSDFLLVIISALLQGSHTPHQEQLEYKNPGEGKRKQQKTKRSEAASPGREELLLPAGTAHIY